MRDQWKDLDSGDRIALLPNGEIVFRLAANEQITGDLSSDVTPPTSPKHHNEASSNPVANDQPDLRVSKTTTLPSHETEPQASKPIPSPHSTDPQPSSADPKATKPAPSEPNSNLMDDILFGDVSPAPPESKTVLSDSKIEGAKSEKALESPPPVLLKSKTAASDDDIKGTKPKPPVESPPVQPTPEDKDGHTIQEKAVVVGKQSVPGSKPVGSTNKKRVLPAWLAGIPDAASADYSATKKAPAKPKAKVAAKRKTKESVDEDTEVDVPPAKV